jgi:hypothetical protein
MDVGKSSERRKKTMLLAGRSKGGPTSRSTWVFVFLVAISISVDAVMLLGLMSMFPVGQLVPAAFAGAILAAGLVATVAEFRSLAKQD